MRNSYIFRSYIGVLMIVVLFTIFTVPTQAHSGDAHDTAHATSVATPAQMEKLIKLLEQTITLLTALKSQQSHVAVPVHITPVIAKEADTPSEDVDEMAQHHDEHAHAETPITTTPRLIIEVEPHNGKTHTHVRYVDKPEDMFFVNSAITDEAGIISEVVARTGLTAEAVKAALVYLQ